MRCSRYSSTRMISINCMSCIPLNFTLVWLVRRTLETCRARNIKGQLLEDQINVLVPPNLPEKGTTCFCVRDTEALNTPCQMAAGDFDLMINILRASDLLRREGLAKKDRMPGAYSFFTRFAGPSYLCLCVLCGFERVRD